MIRYLLPALLPGRLHAWYLRRVWRQDVAKGVSVGFGTVIVTEGLRLGPGVRIGRFARIKVQDIRLDDGATIGDAARITTHRLTMHARSIIDEGVTVAGDPADPRCWLSMGMHSWIFPRCHVDTTSSVHLGRNVGVGGATMLFTHGFWLSQLQGYPVARKPIVMGNDVWIPWDCFIMPGVTIGSGVVIGARSLVSRDVPPGALAVGNPARIVQRQVAADLSWDQRVEMLWEATTEYAAKLPATPTRESGPTYEQFRVGTSQAIRIHADGEPVRWLDDGLNVLGRPPDAAPLEAQWWCMEGGLAAPVSALSPESRRWLQHLRSIGVRYYPLDEVERYRKDPDYVGLLVGPLRQHTDG